ncbi:MAG: hypothetical protein PVG51_03770 [Desulfosarcina sp.]|jgi:hypothetical protein
MALSRLKPTVPKCWLFAASGVLWSTVGLMMCASGIGWLAGAGIVRSAGFGLAGMVLAAVAACWVFGGIAQRNIQRLRLLPDRGCFFAFQAWKSYLIIATMVIIGMALRQSTLPKSGLAIIYIGIGGALFGASLHYYRHLMRMMGAAGRRYSHRRPPD